MLDTQINLIENELRFISHTIHRIEGNGGSDFDRLDECGMSVESALRAIHEMRLDARPANGAEVVPSAGFEDRRAIGAA